jgi:hypothetical protein
MNFIIRHNVPILDEHVLRDEEGNEITTLDAKKLKHISNLANKRIKDTGDHCPIVIGHTKDDIDEEDQPEILGWASNFKVQRFLKTDRKAITVTMKFFKKYLNKIKKYPRRSIELWLNDWKIDPICLLGATTPERDLGLLKLSKSGVRKFSIPYKERIPMQENSQQKMLVDAVMKALEQSDVWKWVKSKMQEEGSDEEPVEEELPGEGMEDEEPPMEDMEDGQQSPFGSDELGEEEESANDMDDQRPEEEEEQEPIRMSAKEPKNTSQAQALMRKRNMKQDQHRIKLSRIERVVDKQGNEITTLRLKLRKAERERDLIQLEAEGVDFDREEELEDLIALPDSLYHKHLQKMRVRYAKSPVTFGSDTRDNSVFNNTRGQAVTNDRKSVTDQAVALATDKHITFEEALQTLEG